MKHLLMTLFAAVLFTFTSMATETKKEVEKKDPPAQKEAVQKDAAMQSCINVNFSCGGSGTACCDGCTLGDLIWASWIADPYICSGYDTVYVYW